MFLYFLALAYFFYPTITTVISIFHLIFCSFFLFIEYKKSQLIKKKAAAISYNEKFQKFLTEEEKEELDLIFTTGKYK